MKESIKRLIAEFHENDLPELFMRDYDIKLSKEFITVIFGLRRVGKTYLIYQKIDELMNKGIDKNRIIYVNFEDERLDGFKRENFDQITEAYYELFPENVDDELYLFFDEIQYISKWELFIKRVYESKNHYITITGSSSRLLSKEIATYLRGRTKNIKLTPLSFKEFLIFKDFSFDISKIKYSKDVYRLKKLFREYLIYGGYPAVVKSPDLVEKKDILRNYLDLTIYKDLIDRYNLRSTDILYDIIRYLIQNLSKLFSTTKLYNILKPEKACSKETVIEYVNYLKEIDFTQLLEKHSYKLKERLVNPKKVMIFDNGICSLFLDIEMNIEKLIENIVHIHLKSSIIQYYKTANNKEVDFFDEKNKYFYQVCYDLSDKKTTEREISALKEALKEKPKSKGIIITYDEEKTIENIRCVPLWRWLLEQSESSPANLRL